MLEAPVHDGVEDRKKIPAHLCQRILYMRRNLIELFPVNESIFFEFSEGFRQHGIGNSGKVLLQLSEAYRIIDAHLIHMMVDYAFMEKVEKYEKQGRDDVPEFMIHISKGDLRGVDHIHFVYSTDEVLYGAKQNFIDACKKYGVKYSVRERPGMIHCYAMLPYFRESKEDFDEIARILAK